MANTDKIVYLPQLQRYDEKIKGWADGKFLKKTDAYSLPSATTTTLGGVKIGTGLNVAADGTATVNETYVDGRVTAVGDAKYALKTNVPGMIPMATASEAGKVYAVAKGASDTVKGTVKYSEGTGLILTDIAASSIQENNLSTPLYNKIDNASTNASTAKQLATQKCKCHREQHLQQVPDLFQDRSRQQGLCCSDFRHCSEGYRYIRKPAYACKSKPWLYVQRIRCVHH